MKKKIKTPKLLSAALRHCVIVCTVLYLVHAKGDKKTASKEKSGVSLNSVEDCELRINELNGNLVDGLAPKEFLELKAICANGKNLKEAAPKGASLFGHKLVILSSKILDGKSGTIIGVIDLQNHLLSVDGFFTVGGYAVTEKSISWSHNSVKIRYYQSGQAKSFFDKQNVGKQVSVVPYAVALLRITRREDQNKLSELTLLENNMERPLTPRLEQIITDTIVDMVVFNQHSQINTCELFSRIVPLYQEKGKYILRSYSREVPAARQNTSPGQNIPSPSAPAICLTNQNENQNTRANRRRRGVGKGSKTPKPAGAQLKLTDMLTRPNTQSRNSGGTASGGGSSSTGGTVGGGGSSSTGGTVGGGGSSSTGGTVGGGGSSSTGGAVGGGGSSSTGGTVGGGGSSSTGGAVGGGGSSSTGGNVRIGSSSIVGTAGGGGSSGRNGNNGKPQTVLTDTRVPLSGASGGSNRNVPVSSCISQLQIISGQSSPPNGGSGQTGGRSSGTSGGSSSGTSGGSSSGTSGGSSSGTSGGSSSGTSGGSSSVTSGGSSSVTSGGRSSGTSGGSSSGTSGATSGGVGTQTQQTSTKVVIKYSISRCTDLMTAFNPEAFKITLPTPNKENDCSCTELPFIMAAYAPELYPNIVSDPPIPITMTGPELLEGGCNLEVGVPGLDEDIEVLQQDDQLPATTVNRAINTIRSYRHGHNLHTVSFLHDNELVSIGQALNATESLFEARGGTAACSSNAGIGVSLPQPSSNLDCNPAAQEETLKLAYDNMLLQVQQHQSEKVNLKFLQENRHGSLKLQSWLEYLPNIHDPANSKFRCRICHSGHQDKLVKDRGNNLAYDEGTNFPTEKQFRDSIRDHVNKVLHKAVLERDERKKLQRFQKAVETQQKKLILKLGKAKAATANMIMTIFTEAKMYLPFSSHYRLMNLFNKLDVHLQFNHHLEEKGAAKMASHISRQYHKLFLTYLTKVDRPMTLLADTGVDSDGHDFLSVLIQTLEQEKPKTFFYRLIPLSTDVTSSGYLNVLREAMAKDSTDFQVPDLWNYMKRNLVALVSDGASTFTGRENGFGVLLSKELFGNPTKLVRLHCSAHRLQLATRHLVDEIPELQVFENQLKSISTFYNQQHAKNLAHITELAAVMNIPLRSISYIFPTRWVTNAELVLKRMEHNMPLLLNDLPAIGSDCSKFTDKTQAEAVGLYNMVSNLKFHGMLYLVADIVNNLNFFSNNMQEAGGLLIGKGHYRADFKNFIDLLKTDYGKSTKNFLDNLTCQKNAHATFTPAVTKNDAGNAWKKVDGSLRCMWQFNEQHPKLELKWTNVVGTQTRTQNIAESGGGGHFSELRETILTTLQKELDNYFPEDDFYLAFDILHPKYFDESKMRGRMYGIAEIETLATRFSLPREATSTEFRSFTYELANSGKFGEYRRMKPKDFWPDILRNQDITLGVNLRALIRRVLVIPPSTASVERSFSILNMIKAPRRGRLTSTRVEDLMRISINVPDNLDFLPIDQLALSWSGVETGSAPFKRKNPKSVDSQSGIPAKQALTSQQDALLEDDLQQQERERVQAAMEEFEIEREQASEAGPLLSFVNERGMEVDLTAENDLGEPELFRTFSA